MELTNRARHDNLAHDFKMDGNARVAMSISGTAIGTRRGVNFVAGTDVVLTALDDATNERVTILVSVPALDDLRLQLAQCMFALQLLDMDPTQFDGTEVLETTQGV